MLLETTTKQLSPDKTNTAHHTQSEMKVKNDMFSATKLSEDALVALLCTCLSFRSKNQRAGSRHLLSRVVCITALVHLLLLQLLSSVVPTGSHTTHSANVGCHKRPMKKSWCYCRQGKQLLRTAMLHFTTDHIEACAALYFFFRCPRPG